MKVVGATLAILIAATGGQSATERLTLRVTPNVSNAPSTVVVKATVEKNAANRYLEIEADSGTFYRSSAIQLEGDRAPLVTEISLKDLPGGEYTVVAVLRDNMGGRTTVRRTVLVLSPFGERP
jgi:mRNA-degrading endonuclease toxin of MazEF toxin-antitoxin module